MSMLQGNWNYPTSIRFGAGRIAELPIACRELGMQRPLLITDRVLAKLPIVSDALTINSEAGLATGLFSEIKANPTGANVDQGTAALREGDHDGVIAFGGGSALDVAKAVALMARQTRPLWDYEDIGDNWSRIDADAMVPVVAVPTTSGTGSEVGRASVIVHEAEHKKAIIFHPRMLPAQVICDPALTVGLPAPITSAVGMDALSHNLEALCAPGFHPQADGIALQGMLLVSRALQRAFEDGSDIEARAQMMAASMMGAAAFQKGLGAMHSMSHPMGAALDAPHGLTNAVVMPYVLLFNRSAIEDKMDQLAHTLDLPGSGFDAVLNWVLKMRQDLGIPHTIEALGFRDEHAAQLAPAAAADSTASTNPLPLSEVSLEQLYLQALHGTLS